MSRTFKQVLSANCKVVQQDAVTPKIGLEHLPIFPEDLDQILERVSKGGCKTTILREINAKRYDINDCKNINKTLPGCEEFQWRLRLVGKPSAVPTLRGGETNPAPSQFSNFTDVINLVKRTFITSESTIVGGSIPEAEAQAPNVILEGGSVLMVEIESKL